MTETQIIRARLDAVLRMKLRFGGHSPPPPDCDDPVICLLEGESYIRGVEPPTDKGPPDTCPTVAAFGRALNDSFGSNDDARTKLLGGFLGKLGGTKGSGALETRRVWMAVDWSIRIALPIALRLFPEFASSVEQLVALSPLEDKASLSKAIPVVEAARASAQALAGKLERGDLDLDLALDLALALALALDLDRALALALARALDLDLDLARAPSRAAAIAAARDGIWATGAECLRRMIEARDES